MTLLAFSPPVDPFSFALGRPLSLTRLGDGASFSAYRLACPAFAFVWRLFSTKRISSTCPMLPPPPPAEGLSLGLSLDGGPPSFSLLLMKAGPPPTLGVRGLPSPGSFSHHLSIDFSRADL